jgi:hypothetical protein
VAGYLHHLKGILSNTDNSEIVLPLFAEFQVSTKKDKLQRD